ncbi:MAG: tellurium resistance protein TerC [Micrococcales bacterium 73-13]|nr:MAG: tellurium resistance protein TerC [Micrococcales bacterium 73-13]
MALNPWFELGSLAILTLILVVDVVIAFRRPHIPSTRESSLWVAFYVVLALIFAGVLWAIGDAEHAGQFVAGWLTEYSLSVDNLFVFLIIMGRFAVPRRLQQPLLMAGIIVALVLRAAFILLGAALIENFTWVFYLFGAFLVYTAWNQAFTGHEDEEQRENRLLALIRRRIHSTDEFHGTRLRVVIDGRRAWTPVIVVLISLGITDLVFALDSIPAIFGITQSAFIVFAANVFALMGLRQLYFLLGDLVERLVYLKYGIAAILAFIGVKLVLHAMHENELPFINGGQGIAWAPEIPTWASLLFIVVAMAIAIVASLIRLRLDARRGDGSGAPGDGA